MKRAFKYRLKPTDEQKQLISKSIGCCRFVWNWALQKKIDDKATKVLAWNQISKDLTALKQDPKYVWLNEVPAQALIAELQHLQTAFAKFFSNLKKGIKPFGFPKFKGKNHKRSFSLQNNVKRTQNRLALKSRTTALLYAIKFDGVPVVYHRPHKGQIGTVTISHTAADRYYVAISTDDGQEPPVPKGGKEISIKRTLEGIELKSSTVTDMISHPLILKKKLARLKVLDKRLSVKRKQNKDWKESKRYAELKQQRAELHEYIAAARLDHQHKMTAQIVNTYDDILIDSIPIKDLMMNHKDSLSYADCALFEIERQLKYKCEEKGKIFRKQ